MALPHLPFAEWVGHPLMLLGTYLHEMGHGVAGLLVGGSFERLEIFGDGSGVAHVGAYHGTGWRRALVSAGGLVGPAVASLICLAAARRAGTARLLLGVFAAANLVALLFVVRGSTGMLFAGGLVLACAAAAAVDWPRVRQVLLVFLAIQLGISVFSRADYLFVEFAHTGAGAMPSDVANMATALGGPYWLWGALCGAFSVVTLMLGAALYLRGIARPDDEPPRLG